MNKLRVNAFSLSLDGYGAGPDQDLNNPLGVGGLALHEWLFAQPHAGNEAETAIDDAFVARSMANLGAWILGRNMFGPIRGPWPDERWTGWWGEHPPYHVPVFVLTNYARPSVTMAGGTTFHFVTGGIHAALEQARAVAGKQDIRLGGGVSTIRQYLQAGLIDELHLVMTPVLLGQGEHLLTGIDLVALGYRCTEFVATPKATHFVLTKG